MGALPNTDQRSALEIGLSPSQVESICEWWRGMSKGEYPPTFVEGMLHGYIMAVPQDEVRADMAFLYYLAIEKRGGYDFIVE